MSEEEIEEIIKKYCERNQTKAETAACLMGAYYAMEIMKKKDG